MKHWNVDAWADASFNRILKIICSCDGIIFIKRHLLKIATFSVKDIIRNTSYDRNLKNFVITIKIYYVI